MGLGGHEAEMAEELKMGRMFIARRKEEEEEGGKRKERGALNR